MQQTQQRRSSKIRKLTEVSRALTYALSLEEVLNLTVAHAAELLDAQKSILMMSDEEGLLSVAASVGIAAERCKAFAGPMDESLLGRLQSLLDVESEDFLGVPLVVGGNVTGILAIASFARELSREDQEWLLSALADQASVALEKTKLDEVIEFREKLLGIVSHDLRTPMTAILLTCRSMLRDEALEGKTRASVGRIKSCAERASRMIHDLLDYTQAHLGGGIGINKKSADMAEIVNQAVSELSVAHPKRTIEVTSHDTVKGDWDEDRLAQVVRNLLGNALHYSPAETPIRIDIDESSRLGVTLSIHNEGPPIARSRLPHIFEPMQRATALNDASRRSVGLGLYIVKHLVEAHKGHVKVFSEKARGTEFTVWLPR